MVKNKDIKHTVQTENPIIIKITTDTQHWNWNLGFVLDIYFRQNVKVQIEPTIIAINANKIIQPKQDKLAIKLMNRVKKLIVLFKRGCATTPFQDIANFVPSSLYITFIPKKYQDSV